MIPSAVIRDRWLAALQRTARGSIVFSGPDGEIRTYRGQEPGPDATFRIGEWGVLERLVARGDIGLGEDYIAGAWQTDNLESLIAYFLLNLEELEGFAHGNMLNRLLFTLHNSLVRRNSLSGSRRNIEAHYDVGNDFYSLWLDETMTYSSALFNGETVSLADAQRSKYGRILARLGKGERSILEVGCGWGGFAEQAADKGHRVTGLTISPSQFEFATARLGAKAEIRLEDYRRSRGTFDSIVSIEMIEAVGERYWPEYFSTLADRLKSGGQAVMQAIVVRDELFAGYRTRSDFIRHYVFPGGMLPSLARLREEAERAGLALQHTFSFGQDYARTLREWGVRMRARQGEIRALGHDEKFLRNWDYYFGICAAAFAVGRTDVMQIEFART
ncbi:MAG: cyclopropane-fatty-acyl-phospholipid synthase family protein [Rhizomicrobium sp.]|jgi:cyclopropane-fatty-acyl-phospholipid synthase